MLNSRLFWPPQNWLLSHIPPIRPFQLKASHSTFRRKFNSILAFRRAFSSFTDNYSPNFRRASHSKNNILVLTIFTSLGTFWERISAWIKLHTFLWEKQQIPLKWMWTCSTPSHPSTFHTFMQQIQTIEILGNKREPPKLKQILYCETVIQARRRRQRVANIGHRQVNFEAFKL